MFETEIQGISLKLVTTPSLFSPRCADPGTLAMLSCTTFSPGDKILDLGCGYGLVGIFAAKVLGPECVFMVDNDPEAIRCASENLVINNVEGATVQVSDGLEQLEQAEFDAIRCNPPYHADFSTARRFIEKGFNRLKIGGAMWMVTKRAPWYRNKLTGVFGGVRAIEQTSYFVFDAQKRRYSYATGRKGS